MNNRVRTRDQSTVKISKSFSHPLSTNISKTISKFMLQKINNLMDTLLDYADKSASRQDCGKKNAVNLIITYQVAVKNCPPDLF